MNKKLISAFMLGLLALGTAGTITSCKDYDGDISSLKNDVAANKTQITQAISDLNGKIASLQASLDQKDSELASLISQNTKSINDQAAEIAGCQADIIALQSDMENAQEAIADLEKLLDTKVDKTVFTEKTQELIDKINKLDEDKVNKDDFTTEVKAIYARIEGVETKLGDALTKIEGLEKGLSDETTARVAADQNLQEQIDALKKYDERIKALEEQLPQLKSALAGAQADILSLQSDMLNAQEDIQTNKKSIEDLTSLMNSLSEKVTKLNDQVNVLEVLVKKTLRSLVFQPDLYYWGIEGTKLLTLNCKAWDLEETAWNHVESVFKASHPLYEAAETFRVLDFTANYHMNPSSADKSLIKDVTILSDDKEYYDDATHSRAAACGLGVANWDASNGMLNVNLSVQDKSKIKTVANDQMVTVFATQVAYGDTTITSDYATLIKEEAYNLYLFHHDAEHGAPTTYGRKNEHCGTCEINAELLHLYQTPYEAGIDYLPQDSCNWNETLDLRKLVGTHFFTSTGVEKDFDVTKYGLSYKFELTGLYLEGNKTSESAHAAIGSDGYTFKPQMPVYDDQLVGQQQSYEKGVQGRQTIGRTPLVRVSLVDEAGTVYAYGYIRIKITEPAEDPIVVTKTNKYITYDTNKGWTYNQECSYPAWSYQTTWIQTEYDIYNMVKNDMGGITREEFEAIYSPDYTSGTEFRQYAVKTAGTAQAIEPVYEENVKVTCYNGGVFQTQDNIGTVTNVVDASVTEDGTRTSIIKWNMTGAQAYAYFVTGKHTNATTAVRYISSDASYPDVYVVLKSGDAAVTYPTATANWSADIISNYWYATDSNTGKSGVDEIHAQVLTPEDAPTKGKTVADFSDMFSDVFNGNFANGMVNILSVTGGSAANKLRVADLDPKYIDFVFSAKNNNLVFNGLENQGYVMSVSGDGKTLSATYKKTTQVVAIIEGSDYKTQSVMLQESAFAKDLLNYKAHNDLKDAIYAIIGLAPVTPCQYKMDIAGTFNVRFLRPLNVQSKDAVVEDANIEKVQDILMKDLVEFNDWRDAWDNVDDTWGPYTYDANGNATNYSAYYGIKSIKVLGVNDGENLSQCPDAKTNLGLSDADADNEAKWVSLSSVSKQVDFVYNEPSANLSTHYLRYRNLSSTLSVCKVKVPVVVEYYWGTLKGYAYITIYGSHHNAAK